jgi:bifunctional non-homologous end joining protein LigD
VENRAKSESFVEPMMALAARALPGGGDWIYEIKFDGYRALALRGGSETRILSRNQRIWAANSLK